jgi:hypothetical protein
MAIRSSYSRVNPPKFSPAARALKMLLRESGRLLKAVNYNMLLHNHATCNFEP